MIDDDARDLGTIVERLAQMVFELRAQNQKQPGADQREYEQRHECEHQRKAARD